MKQSEKFCLVESSMFEQVLPCIEGIEREITDILVMKILIDFNPKIDFLSIA